MDIENLHSMSARTLANFVLTRQISEMIEQLQMPSGRPLKEGARRYIVKILKLSIRAHIDVILVSIVVSIPACHAGDRGSIARRGAAILFISPKTHHNLHVLQFVDFTYMFTSLKKKRIFHCTSCQFNPWIPLVDILRAYIVKLYVCTASRIGI